MYNLQSTYTNVYNVQINGTLIKGVIYLSAGEYRVLSRREIRSFSHGFDHNVCNAYSSRLYKV